MIKPINFSEDRLFSSNAKQRVIAKRLYKNVKDLPIISPHGHTDPEWFAENSCFSNATDLLIKPDHYLLRMLFSQGISMAELGFDDGCISAEKDPLTIWQVFAKHYYLFQGTPTQLWLNYVFKTIFGLKDELCSENAKAYFHHINNCLQMDEFRPRALFEKFNIEVIATTESPLDDLRHHAKIAKSDWKGRVITAFRPDNVVDPEYEGFEQNLARLSNITGINIDHFSGYLDSLRSRRLFFKKMGATSSDHGHLTARTLDMDAQSKEALYQKIRSGQFASADADDFRAQMLTEMATMSIEDGLVMQIHPGVYRNHNESLFQAYGRDRGADIPLVSEYVKNLKPLLNKYGCHPDFSLIIFTLDETTYARELAPLAGHYPALKLGPAWWFNDSPEGMMRFRKQTTETAGFYNTVGFNDDTRAFLSIPARHDVARRIDSAFLAELVSDHRLSEHQAESILFELSYNLAKRSYRL